MAKRGAEFLQRVKDGVARAQTIFEGKKPTESDYARRFTEKVSALDRRLPPAPNNRALDGLQGGWIFGLNYSNLPPFFTAALQRQDEKYKDDPKKPTKMDVYTMSWKDGGVLQVEFPYFFAHYPSLEEQHLTFRSKDNSVSLTQYNGAQVVMKEGQIHRLTHNETPSAEDQLATAKFASDVATMVTNLFDGKYGGKVYFRGVPFGGLPALPKTRRQLAQVLSR